MSARLHRYVRIAEVVIVVGLAIAAGVTYAELQRLRRAPVYLPSYVFEAMPGGEQVRTKGTWVAVSGPRPPMQTVTIECRKSRMECIESAAQVVFINGQGLLESVQTTFEVERWNEAELVSKPAAGPCFSRALRLDLLQKKATGRHSAAEGKGSCPVLPEQSMELVAGYALREAPREN